MHSNALWSPLYIHVEGGSANKQVTTGTQQCTVCAAARSRCGALLIVPFSLLTNERAGSRCGAQYPQYPQCSAVTRGRMT